MSGATLLGPHCALVLLDLAVIDVGIVHSITRRRLETDGVPSRSTELTF